MHSTSVSLLERLRLPEDQAAWTRFVDLYTPLLYHWARRMNLQQHDAADLVQEVFAVLLQKLPAFQYNRAKSFRSWLRMVTFNKWREKCRGKTEQANGVLGEVIDQDHAADLWEKEYQQELVGRALEIMRRDFQPATWKACWELVVAGRPAAEVAAELHISENAVYLAKGRVLRRLRQELADLLD